MRRSPQTNRPCPVHGTSALSNQPCAGLIRDHGRVGLSRSSGTRPMRADVLMQPECIHHDDDPSPQVRPERMCVRRAMAAWSNGIGPAQASWVIVELVTTRPTPPT